jgi:hypothetical protein
MYGVVEAHMKAGIRKAEADARAQKLQPQPEQKPYTVDDIKVDIQTNHENKDENNNEANTEKTDATKEQQLRF